MNKDYRDSISQQSVHFTGKEVIIRATADQEDRVASGQGQGDPLEQVPENEIQFVTMKYNILL